MESRNKAKQPLLGCLVLDDTKLFAETMLDMYSLVISESQGKITRPEGLLLGYELV